jgi:hypothetical protein
MADTSHWAARVIAAGEGWLPLAALSGALWLFASAAMDLPPPAADTQSPANAIQRDAPAVPSAQGAGDQAARPSADGAANGRAAAAAAAFRQ